MRSVALLLSTVVLLAATPVFAAGDVALGEKSYAKCKVCHTLDKGGKNLVGPNLNGVFGRKAGTVPGFAYSKGLVDMGITWDATNMAVYVTDPKKFNPGSKMVFVGIKNPKEVEDLIAYLQQATK